jgi:hypothetical protein
MEEHDTTGIITQTTRSEFIKIAKKEKIFEVNPMKEKNTKWWLYNSSRSERGNMELCRKRKILANAGELFIKMCEQGKAEQEIRKEMKYWKNLQATKKYQLKAVDKKKDEAAEKVTKQTELEKKIKARWAGRKERKRTRKKGIKKINWEYFYQNFFKARDESIWLAHQKQTIMEKIISKHGNIRLMDEEQFDDWQTFYFEGINEIAENEQSARQEVLEAIFTHKLLTKEYHYEPLSPYTKDDFQQLRCCWMMFGYYIMKRRRKLNDICSNMNKVRYKTIGLTLDNSTFGKQFKQFTDESTEECSHENRIYYNNQLFYNDSKIEHLESEYFTPDPS